jgi:two-component system, LytTR family, sensor kinase
MKTLKFESLKIHIIVWAIFIGYEVLVVYTLTNKSENFYDYTGHYILNICLFYLNAHVVLPTVMSNKKPYFLVAVTFIAELVVYIILRYLILDLYAVLTIPVSESAADTSRFLISCSWRGTYFIGLSTAYWLAISTIQNRKKIDALETMQLRNELQTRELEKTLLTTENAYLKSQINPHFLLNTLNFLYNSVSKFSEKIADSVMTLSDIMRYALTNADDDGKVMLESEIDHIGNFIKLNQARFSEKLCIDLTTGGDTAGLRIIPLVLITLAENVFKYGDLQNNSYPAKIIVNIEGNTLTFITQNLKKKRAAERSYGIGIKNVKSRLAMYHQYELTIEDNETEYKSVLKIEL